MSQKQFHVQLSEQERVRLQKIIRSGKDKARKITRCRVLLLADGPTGKTDQEISDALNVCRPQYLISGGGIARRG